MNESIITKYRPEEFSEVRGQDAVVRSLESAIEKHVARAYLFAGPSGVGKTTLARLAAKELGCEDIQEEDLAVNTGIENIRDLIDGLLYKPFSGKGKALILDECFIEGTLITVPDGTKPIEQLKPGDLVRGIKGIQTVGAVLSRKVPVSRIVRVTLAGGQYFYCSREHPFLSLSGWRPVERLNGKRLIQQAGLELSQSLCDVWDHVYEQKQQNAILRKLSFAGMQDLWKNFQDWLGPAPGYLLKSLSIQMVGSSWWSTFPRKQPIMEAWSSRFSIQESCSDQEEAWHTFNLGGAARKQRQRSYQSASVVTSISWWLFGICDLYWQSGRGRWLSALLQSRYWVSRLQTCCRSGWKEPSSAQSAGKRRQEGKLFERVRVESASLYELRDFKRCNGNSNESEPCFAFYDLTIIEHPSFCLESGLIAHNCHALSKPAITSLLKVLEDPPNSVYWFLCTTEPAKIPKAIQTRCLTFQLKEVSTLELIELLENTDEGKDLDSEILSLCAREANGSPRQALANLGVCLTVEDRHEAAELLRSAGEAPQAFELARLLMQRPSWPSVQKLLEGLKDTSPESVRQVVRAYMTKVALTSSKDSEAALAVLEAFAQPFHSADGISPVVLACGKLVFQVD